MRENIAMLNLYCTHQAPKDMNVEGSLYCFHHLDNIIGDIVSNTEEGMQNAAANSLGPR